MILDLWHRNGTDWHRQNRCRII